MEILLENGAGYRWWEDSHGLSTDGSSLVVTLAIKEKRLDLLEKLLANSKEAFPKKDNQGAIHKIFERSDLHQCLGCNEAILLLVKNGLTNIDPENFHEVDTEEMVKRFEIQGEGVTVVQEELWYSGSQKESEPWSDRHAYKQYGRVTGVEVAMKGLGAYFHNYENGNYGYEKIRIGEVRFRHESIWQSWKMPEKERHGPELKAFVLDENESVVQVRTNSDHEGYLGGLEVTTSNRRQFSWGDLDIEYRGGQRKTSTVEGANLGYCSGLRCENHVRNITFHWVME